ncbi:mannose-6-phosphate isomerase, class I [Aeribacillus composti]|jgi:Phosphomannose isomerase|uniref:mannose-6-phosphate isomerase, class I n=1 Tax=Aeribacillus composti TaxID=1868734 RepID=UPI002E22AF1C|nr:mannose-6-phosphate isomerase, class I [Aeribacillus composti]
MNQQPIFFEPVFKERIWGGTALRDQFGYDIPSEQTGECWAISAHPNGQSVVKSGEWKGWTLDQLWKDRRELFGGMEGEKFPLLTKILDANHDLSVQVHPDDQYAQTHENGELGKTECWYIIDCEKDAEMIFGHTAKTKEELVRMIEEGRWDDLLQRVKIKLGDFYYVPSGTIHALCKGTLVLETQQNSDTTYRVYDYDRTDDNGNKRELHLEKAIDVITVPHTATKVEPKTEEKQGATITTYVQAPYFSVYKWSVNGIFRVTRDKPFLLCSVLSGSGKLKTAQGEHPFKKGDHFLIPATIDTFEISGETNIIVSHV